VSLVGCSTPSGNGNGLRPWIIRVGEACLLSISAQAALAFRDAHLAGDKARAPTLTLLTPNARQQVSARVAFGEIG
jgi:hypothetical protein